jgi:diaminopimelate epimerase
MYIQFEKWQACQNDFLVIWSTFNEAKFLIPALQKAAPQLCHRRGLGVGADGLLVLLAQSKQDVMPQALTVLNQDGSVGQNCGNGLRCVAMSIYNRHNQASLPEEFSLDLAGRSLGLSVVEPVSGQSPKVMVTMGSMMYGPELLGKEWLPAKAWVEAQCRVYGLGDWMQKGTDWALGNLGNLHLVFFPDPAFTANRDWRSSFISLAEALQTPPVEAWWQGVNVHVAHPYEGAIPPQERGPWLSLGLRIGEEGWSQYSYERGCGTTMACGSGVCVVAARVFLSGLIPRGELVGIHTEGGWVFVRHEHEDSPVQLMGGASQTFTGVFPL